jgi:hypothetical protein
MIAVIPKPGNKNRINNKTTEKLAFMNIGEKNHKQRLANRFQQPMKGNVNYEQLGVISRYKGVFKFEKSLQKDNDMN